MADESPQIPSVEGWPATVDPDHLYQVVISRPFMIGPTAHNPGAQVALRGDVMNEKKDCIARVIAN